MELKTKKLSSSRVNRLLDDDFKKEMSNIIEISDLKHNIISDLKVLRSRETTDYKKDVINQIICDIICKIL